MDRRALRLHWCLLAITLGGTGCGAEQLEEVAAETTETSKSALTFGSCTVPTNYATATFLGRKAMAGNTASATTGDSLLPANNVVLGTYPAGTTIIVGFQGLNQSAASLTGDTYIRLFDNSGEVASGDDACGGRGARIVYTVPQGNRTLTARLGCYSNGSSCAGDLYSWSRLDSNGQLTNVLNAHKAIIMGSNASGVAAPNEGSYGGTSVRQLANPIDETTNHFRTFYDPPTDRVAPVQGGGKGYISNGSFGIYSHFEGVQRLRNHPSWVAVSGAFRGDVMFGYVGGSAWSDKSWLTSGATTPGSLAFRFCNYDVPAPAAENTVVTQFNHFGGIQTSGKYIVGGVSNYPDHNPAWGRLLLLDASNPANVGATSTMRKWLLDPQIMSGATSGIGPSQVGMTKLRSGAFLMAMSRDKQKIFDFYLKDIDEPSTLLTASNTLAGFADIEDRTFGTPSNPNPRGWTVQNAATGATGGVEDNNGIALVTETNGAVFLLNTTWATPYSKSWVQQVILTPTSSGAPKYTAHLSSTLGTNLGYQCAGSSVACNFLGAAGFYINSFDDTLEVYSTNMFLNDNSPPTIGVSEFTSNMAHGRTVYASSVNPSYPPASATNGNLTDWARTNSEASPWSYVDLGSVKTVTGIKIFPCPAGSSCTPPANFNVWTWNGSGWEFRLTRSGAMQAGVPESFKFPAVSTQYVLIQLSGTGPLELSEYQVY